MLEAELLADHVAIIRRGRIIFSDTPNNLKVELLGPAQYEARFTEGLNGAVLPEFEGVLLMERGDTWARYQVENPMEMNAILLQGFLEQKLKVYSFQEVHRSLEDAYLEAVARVESQNEEAHV